MTHLSLENLARLLDEEPSRSEAEHLAGCSLCRSELDSLRADRDALGALPDLLPPPPSAWPDLAERMKAEGLIRSEVTGETSIAPARVGGRRFLYLAASLALFLLGGSTGYLIRAYDDAGSGTGGALAYENDRGKTTSPGSGSIGGGKITPGDEIAAAEAALQEAEAVYRAALLRFDEVALGNNGSGAHLSQLAELMENASATTDTATAGRNVAGAIARGEPLPGAYRVRYVAGAEVVTLNPGLARYFDGASAGVLILRVEPGTPAANSGLEVGDVVIMAAGSEVQTADALWHTLARRTDDLVDLVVVRQGERLELQLRL